LNDFADGFSKIPQSFLHLMNALMRIVQAFLTKNVSRETFSAVKKNRSLGKL